METPICPCAGSTHPRLIFNPPGRDEIIYRIGDYASFRQALLLPLAGESQLVNWHPGAEGDLAVQMMEWWAYLAEILTFYNDRAANESYVRTADLPESVRRSIGILGYRPRPGIGARGVVAALTHKAQPFVLPQGFQIQSKPGPGKQPQIFELDADTPIRLPDAIPAVPFPNPNLLVGASVLLKGNITGIKAGDRLLLVEKGWSGARDGYAFVTVQQVEPEPDPAGKPNTRITFTQTPSLSHALASQFRLLKSQGAGRVWQYDTDSGLVIQSNEEVHLDKIAPQIQVGDLILFEIPSQRIADIASLRVSWQEGLFRDVSSAVKLISETKSEAIWRSNLFSPLKDFADIARAIAEEERALEKKRGSVGARGLPPHLAIVEKSTEKIWYANGDPANPEQPAASHPDNVPLIPIPHAQLTIAPSLEGDWDAPQERWKRVAVHYDWQDVGELIATPTPTFRSDDPRIATDALPAKSGSIPILLEDASDRGLAARAAAGSPPPVVQLSDLDDASLELQSPLRLLLNRLPVSRGQTVPSEILGSGDARLAGQEFVLKKSPLTYLLSGDSTSGGNYKSTLRVWVDAIEWQEVPSFYGQAPEARIFVTREDEQQQTHVQFGDGINGARLPSGVNNVVARYRYGSGKEVPDAGTLNVIVKPYPNLKAIRNPVPAGGGADPEPAEQIRRYAPRSVLAFGRAVSGDDYEAIAAQTPGVNRAKVYWTWDAAQQRSLVKLYVGDDSSAVSAAKVALAGTADPNRPVAVELAQPVPVKLTLTLQIEATRLPETVLAAVQEALLHGDRGLFGSNAVPIGQAIYNSQIYAVCLGVPGVLAVHDANFEEDLPSPALSLREKIMPKGVNRLRMKFVKKPLAESHYRHDPGEGRFYQLDADNLALNWEVS